MMWEGDGNFSVASFLVVLGFLKITFPFCLAEMVQSVRAFGWFEQRLASPRYRTHESGKGSVGKTCHPNFAVNLSSCCTISIVKSETIYFYFTVYLHYLYYLSYKAAMPLCDLNYGLQSVQQCDVT